MPSPLRYLDDLSRTEQIALHDGIRQALGYSTPEPVAPAKIVCRKGAGRYDVVVDGVYCGWVYRTHGASAIESGARWEARQAQASSLYNDGLPCPGDTRTNAVESMLARLARRI